MSIPRAIHRPIILWPEHKITALRDLWAKGLSASDIGVKLQMSKDSVINKAHRLGLSARPNPVKPRPEPVTPPSERMKYGLHPLPALHPISWGVIIKGTLLDGQPC